jgi:hypothetical protein
VTEAIRSGAGHERRVQARRAFWDHLSPPPIKINGTNGASESLDEAIEVATRVKVTSEIIDASMAEPFISTEEALKRAFRAAGFEVAE